MMMVIAFRLSMEKEWWVVGAGRLTIAAKSRRRLSVAWAQVHWCYGGGQWIRAQAKEFVHGGKTLTHRWLSSERGCLNFGDFMLKPPVRDERLPKWSWSEIELRKDHWGEAEITERLVKRMVQNRQSVTKMTGVDGEKLGAKCWAHWKTCCSQFVISKST